MTTEEPVNFAQLDDTALLEARARMRAELDRLPPLSEEHILLSLRYTASTAEINERARRAWTREA